MQRHHVQNTPTFDGAADWDPERLHLPVAPDPPRLHSRHSSDLRYACPDLIRSHSRPSTFLHPTSSPAALHRFRSPATCTAVSASGLFVVRTLPHQTAVGPS